MIAFRMMFHLVRLSHNNLETAVAIVKTCFEHLSQTTALPERALRAALEPDFARSFQDMDGVLSRDFWLAEENGAGCGVIGLMEREEDTIDTDWLNWFCILPMYRGKGYGRFMLENMVTESSERKKKFLRLWTTDSPNELEAQYLYEKMGFVVTSQEPYVSGMATLCIYRCKTL